MKKFLSFFAAAMLAVGFTSCEEVDDPYVTPDVPGDSTTVEDGKVSLPYEESFAKSLGQFKNYTTDGQGAWVIDYSTAKATGYDNATTVTTAGTYYLVSPEIDLTGVAEAHVAYEYILRYDKGQENQQVLITTAFDEANPAAGWTVLNGTHKEGVDWATFEKADLQIPAEYLGQKVRVAFRYNTNATSGSTWEVKNFLFAEGKAAEAPGEDEPETPVEGENTMDNPMTVTQALAAYVDGQSLPACVKGYIVGYVDGASLESGAKFEGTNVTSETNVLIAASADETNVANCIPVQLPSGAVRTGVNLKANPGNFKKEVTLKGKIEKYFRVCGLKTVTEFRLGEGGGNVTPDTPDTPAGEGFLSIDFTQGQGGWTINDVLLPEGGSYVWQQTAQYGMKASAFIGGAGQASESWLISPKFDLSAAKTATLNFSHAQKFAKDAASELFVLASTDGKEWKQLNVSAWPDGSNWNFIDATADLSAFAGKNNVQVAFKYTSVAGSAATWEIKTVTVE